MQKHTMQSVILAKQKMIEAFLANKKRWCDTEELFNYFMNFRLPMSRCDSMVMIRDNDDHDFIFLKSFRQYRLYNSKFKPLWCIGVTLDDDEPEVKRILEKHLIHAIDSSHFYQKKYKEYVAEVLAFAMKLFHETKGRDDYDDYWSPYAEDFEKFFVADEIFNAYEDVGN